MEVRVALKNEFSPRILREEEAENGGGVSVNLPELALRLLKPLSDPTIRNLQRRNILQNFELRYHREPTQKEIDAAAKLPNIYK